MVEKIVLDNGLSIYLINDNTKHTTFINLIVNFGGITDCVMVNNKKRKIKNGVAHFLEHLVLEKNSIGDLMQVYADNGVNANGLTSLNNSRYYVDLVDDPLECLKILISGIHTPNINKDNINDIRKPILEEKNRSLDNKYTNIYNTSIKDILNLKNFKSVLGNIKDIESINEKDLIDSFNYFYRPNNEIIIIGGNFNKDNVLNVINEEYNKLKFSSDIISVPKIVNSSILKKETIIKEDINIGRTIISFKLKDIDATPYDKAIIDTYLYYFFKMNFGITSAVNRFLIENNIIVGNLSFYIETVAGINILRIEANTYHSVEFSHIILDIFINKKYTFDEKLFDLYNKIMIVDMVVRSDNIYTTVDSLIDNILSYSYDDLDKIHDVEKLNFKDYKKNIMTLDFNNYNISSLVSK